MNVLLLSMPDSFEHMPPVAIRMPNGALASLAGNIDPHHHVAVADLILVQSSVRTTVERMVRDLAPDVVGLSVMTFQRHTALKIIALVRALCPTARIVVGGYDASLDIDAYTQSPDVDFIVRGEGEHTLCELLRRSNTTAMRRHRRLVVPDAGRFSAQRDRGVAPLATSALRCQTAPRAFCAATRCSDGASTWSKRRAAAPTTAASARSSRCAAATSTRIPSIGSWRTSRMPARTAPRRFSWLTTTSRWTSNASRSCAPRSSTPASTISITPCRR